MSNNTNYFAMEEELNEFEMWQGLRGPYYTPSVSPDGELSWTNNGSLPNPAPVNLTGPAGKSAYEAAREGGYQGTEAEFNEALAEIDTALQPSDVDSQLSGTSENPVQNKAIYDALQNIHIDVDDELSDSSENPVQNKVITQELADQKSAIEGKQDAPTDAGLAGQVLGLDEDLNPVWLDQTGGGGGGTTNYNNLTNKPRINGVLLSGDKSAADLGLAAASDIPTSPVQSVNGKTGTVVLDASDVGALPASTAIPSKTSDLTNDSGFVNATGAAAASPVQSINGQTGNVTISVPSAASSGTPDMDGTANRGSSDEYARADHVHPTDTTRAAAAELATYTRTNLLDNWYFVGGGSQQGYGVFPINQRGQTTYSGSGFCIDRFRGDYSTKELSADGLTVTRTGAGTWAFLQDVSTPPILGETITFSALITDYSGNARLQITWFEGSTQQQVYNPIRSVGVTSVTLSVPSAASRISAIVWIGAENDYVKLTAVKVEVGSNQTLAHQENGAWVLNEIPNYSDELTKCRRYYRRYVSNSVYDFCLNGCLTSAKQHLLVALPDGTPMVKRTPTATISGSVIVRGVNGYIANPSTETLAIANNGIAEGYGATLPIQKSTDAVWTDEDINNTPIQVGLTAGTIIEISAE